MSTDIRNEALAVCDILSLETLVDETTYKLVASAKDAPSATAVLGPFMSRMPQFVRWVLVK